MLNVTTPSPGGTKALWSECVNTAYLFSDLLVRHERLTHRKDRENQKDRAQPSTEPSNALEEEPSRKRMRASFDTGRPVPEIPGMISSPAVSEIQPIRHTPATSFSPMAVAHDSSYSLTALSMAAEYQSLQGNMADGDSLDQSLTTQSALPSATMNVTFEPAHTVMPSHTDFNGHGPSLEESLDSLTYFLDNEPLNSYHFATLMSAEQPMYVHILSDTHRYILTCRHKAFFLAGISNLQSGRPAFCWGNSHRLFKYCPCPR